MLRDRRARNSQQRRHRKLIALGGLLASVAIFVPLAVAASSPIGKLDRSFGESGRVFTNLGDAVGTANFLAIMREDDGKLLVGGAFQEPSGSRRLALQRRNPDGSLDLGFGGGTGQIGVASLSGLSIGSSGAIQFASSLGCASSALERLLADGSPDPSFGQGGIGASVSFVIEDSVAQPDGKIVVAGAEPLGPCGGKLMPASQLALARYQADGSLDRSFGVGGIVATEALSGGSSSGLTIEGSGRIVLATEREIVGLTTIGAIDQGFGGGGKIPVDGSPFAPTITSEGKLVVGVDLSSASETARATGDIALLRYDPNGTPDPSFGANGKATVGFGNVNFTVADALAVGSEGGVTVGGTSQAARCVKCPRSLTLARLDAQGRLDPSFGAGGKMNLARPVALLPEDESSDAAIAGMSAGAEGHVIVAASQGGSSGGFLASLLPRGGVDTGFAKAGYLYETFAVTGNQLAQSLSVAGSGAIYVSAIASAGATALRPVLVRYTPDGVLDRDFGGDGFIAVPPTYSRPLAGRRDSCYLIVKPAGSPYLVMSILPDGSADPSFGKAGFATLPDNLLPRSFVLDDKGKIIVVGRKLKAGLEALRLTQSGRRDPTFGHQGQVSISFPSSGGGIARAVGVQPDGRIVVAGRVGHTAVLARLLPNGAIDRSFADHGRARLQRARWSNAIGMIVLGRGVLVTVAERDPPGVVLVRLDQAGRPQHEFGKRGTRELFGGGQVLGVLGVRGRIITAEARSRAQKSGVRLHEFNSRGEAIAAFGHRGQISGGVNQQPRFFARDVAAQAGRGIVVVGSAGAGGAVNEIELMRFR